MSYMQVCMYKYNDNDDNKNTNNSNAPWALHENGMGQRIGENKGKERERERYQRPFCVRKMKFHRKLRWWKSFRYTKATMSTSTELPSMTTTTTTTNTRCAPLQLLPLMYVHICTAIGKNANIHNTMQQ